MRSIFLSASIPVKERDAKYIKTVDVTSIRDSVLALVEVCLNNDIRIIWSGHPAITPLVYQAINQLTNNNDMSDYHSADKSIIQKYVRLFQSDYFRDNYPKDNEFFENIIFTECCEDRSKSLLLLRERMIESEVFFAGVFIGGMDGVEEEYLLFKEKHPKAICLPIASTGAAAEIIFNRNRDNCNFPDELCTNYAYNALFYKYLAFRSNDNRQGATS